MKNNILTTSEDSNINYVAQIVRLTHLEPHPNADKLQLAVIQGQKVITSLDAQIGQFYVYFPVECEISENFLSFCNLFDEADRNKDKTKKGYVHKSGRVRMLKLRNVYSEGLLLPVSLLEDYVKQIYKKDLNCVELEGTSFDDILGDKFVRKFVVKLPEENVRKVKTKGNVKKYESKLIEGQFAFHPDTSHLKRQVNELSPDDYISIENKIHGANFLVANVLIKRKLSWRDKIAKLFGVKVKDSEYGNLYASRTILKNSRFTDESNLGFYKEDIWKEVSNRLFPKLDQGITATGEVFGYTSTGGWIQKGYDYGCNVGELNYIVFNLTYTAPDGNVFTFSHPQLVEYCRKKNIPMAETFYYGKAKDLFPEISVENHWHDNFLNKLCDTYLEKKCHLCKSDVWAEGVILRIDKPNVFKAYKLKSANFLGYETKMLDAGESGVFDYERAEDSAQ
jgi:hypothetical protein